MITLSSSEVTCLMSHESPKVNLLPLWRRMEFTVRCDEIHFAGKFSRAAYPCPREPPSECNSCAHQSSREALVDSTSTRRMRALRKSHTIGNGGLLMLESRRLRYNTRGKYWYTGTGIFSIGPDAQSFCRNVGDASLKYSSIVLLLSGTFFRKCLYPYHHGTRQREKPISLSPQYLYDP